MKKRKTAENAKAAQRTQRKGYNKSLVFALRPLRLYSVLSAVSIYSEGLL
jgi:hypothetical protein